MPELKDWLPAPPPNPPLPRFLLEKQENIPPAVQHDQCEYGINCIKDHMGRAHLYITEAIRFSSAGEITPEARHKVRLVRAEIQCEDDFAAAMEAPPEVRAEVLKLLAACRSTWKAMDLCGVDSNTGTVQDLQDINNSINALWQKAYDIDSQFKLLKESAGT
jgi:hypothetical protein